MARIVLAFCVMSSIIGIVFAQSTPPPAKDASDAVFLLTIYEREPGANGQFHGDGFGTGFFISPDGTGLTASHVVYAAAHYPNKYRLLAIVDKEFYDATVVCSSTLPYDAMVGDPNQGGVPLTRDVAEVKLAPTTAFEGRKDELYLLYKDGTKLTWATAHKDALPVFAYLTIGGAANVGSSTHVRVVGFGVISAIPRKWTSEGQVRETWSGRDGTPLFSIESSNPAQPGDSGSPVLNDQNQVVGLWAWHSYNKPMGFAQRSSAFERPCP